MNIHNMEEHSICYCYDNKENPLVKLVEIKSGELNKVTLSSNEIVFILEGKICCASCDKSNEEFNKGQLLFLPMGDHLCYRAAAMSEVLVLRLIDNMHLCNNFNVKQLYNNMSIEEKSDFPFPLEINARLWHFAQGLIDTWHDGLKCKIYLRAEISKLLIMLPVYYSKEELSRFFYPILSPDSTFSEYVRLNHIKHRTVNEFAAAINMTAQQFTRRFHTVFGQAPYEWMQEQRARLIYGEITQGNKPLKEIAVDFGFTDQANFNRFCRAFFETTPGKMRKNKP